MGVTATSPQTHDLSAQTVLRTVAERTGLREGPEGVRAIVLAVTEGREIATREIAATVRLPLPVVAAVRGELTALGIFERRARGVALTQRGRILVAQLFGGDSRSRQAIGPSLDDETRSFAVRIGPIAEARPDADVTLDQAKATPLTLARRVAYFDRSDAIAGRRILVLGDDDFVSAAIVEWSEWQTAQLRSVTPQRLAVAEIDQRIRDMLDARGGVETVTYDARRPFPDELRGAFDVVITDPPYTLYGAELFLSRAIDAVGATPGAKCFLSFGHKDPTTMRGVQASLAEMGWTIREWQPGFNEYEGSSVIAGTSLMAQLVLAECATPLITGHYDGPLYTADARPAMVRLYRCQGCNAEWQVGPGTRWQTVGHLKRQTCPLCRADRFRRVGQHLAR